MVNVLASSVVDGGFDPHSGQVAVDRGFKPRSDQTIDYKIGICCFLLSTQH